MEIVNFTPIPALTGGILIGLAGLLLLLLNGRIAGVSGIFGRALSLSQGDNLWGLYFLMGLVLGGLAYTGLGGSLDDVDISANMVEIVAAGLLVGFGTQLGSGCTSGHGVCGIGRMSPRGIVSTLTYMGSGIVFVYLFQHVLKG